MLHWINYDSHLLCYQLVRVLDLDCYGELWKYRRQNPQTLYVLYGGLVCFCSVRTYEGAIMKFIIDESLFEQAVQNPFRGSNSPVKAAYGRAAEASIIEIASNRLNVKIRPGAEVKRSEIPDFAVQAKWLTTRDHDGLVFSEDGVFLGLNETKLKIAGNSVVRLTAGEYRNLVLCKKNDLVYLLSIAEQIKHFDAEYLGTVDLTHHLDILKPNSYDGYDVSIKDFKRFL